MNIDTNNAFSGKVKFLQGGAGATIVNNVVPIIIPSNLGQDGVDFIGSMELPLNVTASVFDTTLQNTSFIPNENNTSLEGFKVWIAQSHLEFFMTDGNAEDTAVQVTLVIDGVNIETIATTLNIANGYKGFIDFDYTSGTPTLIETSIKFLVEAFVSGSGVPSTKTITIPSTTTILYSNEYTTGRYYGFLSSYLATNFIIDDSVPLREIGFGGSYFNLTTGTAYQNVAPFGFAAMGIYVVFSAVSIVSIPFLAMTLVVNGVDTDTLNLYSFNLQELLFVAYPSRILINSGDVLQLRVQSVDASGDSWQIQEIGLVYRIS